MTQSDTQTAAARPHAGVNSAPIGPAATPSTGPHSRPAATATAPTEPQSRPADDLVEDDLLVEDVSIDGMCGVY